MDAQSALTLRLALHRGGYCPLPLYGKAPPMAQWSKLENVSREQIEMWTKTWPDAINTGCLTKLVPTLDADILNEAAAAAIEELVREFYEERGHVLTRIGRPPKRAFPFRTDEPFAKITINLAAGNGVAEKLEFLGDGQQVVVAGIHPDTHKPYVWFGGELTAIPRSELPYIREAEARQLIERVADLLCRDFGYQRAAERPRKTTKDNNDDARNGAADWQYLCDRIHAGEALHDSLCALSAKLIAARMEPGAAVNFMRGLMDASSTDRDARWQERYADIPRLVEGATARFAKPEPAERVRPLISATPFVWREPKLITPRQWLYGIHLIRKFGSATIALSGIGKTSQLIVEALAMVTGRPLLGITPKQRCKVWLWNGEEPLDEIERRIAAACLHYGITPLEIEGGLFVDSGRISEIVIATQTRDGAKIAIPTVEALIKTIHDNGIDAVQIDPFISSHQVTENDNNAIDIVAKTWTRIADITNTAIDLSHHARKTAGGEVTVEDSRGAIALVNAVRSVRVLNTMTEAEADQAGITGPGPGRRSHFKLVNGKLNLAPPPDQADWFRMKSVALGNGPPDDPTGDKIAVVTAWKWPQPLDGVTGKDFDKVASAIRQGEWRESSQAKAWVGYAVAKALKLDATNKADKAKIKGMLKVWIGVGSLIVVTRADPDRREAKEFVEVAPEKDPLAPAGDG